MIHIGTSGWHYDHWVGPIIARHIAEDTNGLPTPGVNAARIPGFQNVAAALKERFGHDDLMPFTESAYDAAATIGLAAAKAIADGREIDYAGAAGACNYDERGDVITPQAIWKFTETGIETVEVVSADKIPPE